jgi:large subunit ribosomal protein L30
MAGKSIKVTLVASKNHRSPHTRAILETLGLKKIRTSRVLPDNAAIRGACVKLAHMVKVEEVSQ